VVRFRPVEVGITGENYFEILSGLEAGTEVVSGTFQAIRELRDGSRIEIDNPERRPGEREPSGQGDE